VQVIANLARAGHNRGFRYQAKPAAPFRRLIRRYLLLRLYSRLHPCLPRRDPAALPVAASWFERGELPDAAASPVFQLAH